MVDHAAVSTAHAADIRQQLAAKHAVLAERHHQQLVHHFPPGPEDDEDRLNPLVAILLIYAILFLMIMAQAGLVLWRKRHQRSYDLVTLVGLWLMPPIFCIQLHFYRFLAFWTCYSAVTIYLLSLCMKKKMEITTPRLVYSWFLGAYRVSLGVGVVGYALLLTELLGLGPLIYLLLPRGTAMDLVWYGIYFGVLGRDCAEVASDRMAANLGSGGRRLLNTANSCGICGNAMEDFSHMGEEPPEGVEPCVQLSCKHCFHNLCIRGWTMVGKKDVCPVCMEKVDLRELYSDRPWETRNLTWIQMLDTVRYLVVWNPIILMVMSVLLHFLPHGHHHHPLKHLHGMSPPLPGLAAGGLPQPLLSPSPALALGGHAGATA